MNLNERQRNPLRNNDLLNFEFPPTNLRFTDPEFTLPEIDEPTFSKRMERYGELFQHRSKRNPDFQGRLGRLQEEALQSIHTHAGIIFENAMKRSRREIENAKGHPYEDILVQFSRNMTSLLAESLYKITQSGSRNILFAR
jgi:hypothetical protein